MTKPRDRAAAWADGLRLADCVPAALAPEADALQTLLVPRMMASMPPAPDPQRISIAGESLVFPRRLCFTALGLGGAALREADGRPLRGATLDLFRCLLSRSHDGHQRQSALRQVFPINRPWSIPYVLRPIGEYVLEILRDIDNHLYLVDPGLLAGFLRDNPRYLGRLGDQVESYWYAYFRHVRRQDHLGFRLLETLRAMTGESRQR